MRAGIWSVVGRLFLVSILAAQSPVAKSQERVKSGDTSPTDDESRTGKDQPARELPRRDIPPGAQKGGFRGFSRESLPSQPQRGFVPANREPAAIGPARTTEPAERAGLGLPRNLAPLPPGTVAGKSLILDVCFAETADPLPQPSASDLLEMERNGKLKSNARVRLLLLENQPAFAQFGELASKVSGHTITNVKVIPIYSSMNVGTMVQATGRIEDDGAILMQVYVEKSGLVPSDEPPETRRPESITRVLAQSTVRLKSGEPTVLSGGPDSGSDSQSQCWIVLSCKPL
jgi:hypothetical protein